MVIMAIVGNVGHCVGHVFRANDPHQNPRQHWVLGTCGQCGSSKINFVNYFVQYCISVHCISVQRCKKLLYKRGQAI